MSDKDQGVLVDIVVYLGAFMLGLIPFIFINNIIVASLMLTVVATAAIFVVTCFVPDTSIYDPYWSVAPIVILLCDVIKYKLFNINALLVGLVFLFWGTRLTLNWYYTYKGILHEDWRYKMQRDKLSKVGFFFVNLVGLQYVPTFVVFASFMPAIVMICNPNFNPLIIIGLVISIAAVVLEIVADHTVHKFIKEKKNNPNMTKQTCDVGVWKYSRHPNYLGEISFWFGIFVAFLGTNINVWYYGLGYILMPCLFLFISIPLMEGHNIERRSDYVDYQKRTSMLLILPNKKEK